MASLSRKEEAAHCRKSLSLFQVEPERELSIKSKQSTDGQARGQARRGVCVNVKKDNEKGVATVPPAAAHTSFTHVFSL